MWIHFYSWGSLFVGSKNVPGFWRPYFFDSVIGIIKINIKQMVVHTFMGQGFPTKAINIGPSRIMVNLQLISGNSEDRISKVFHTFTLYRILSDMGDRRSEQAGTGNTPHCIPDSCYYCSTDPSLT